MTSRRAPGDKRAAPPKACDYTKAFLKDWERLSHSGRFDLKRLKEAMLLLIANDFPLKGEWTDHRECHIGGDFLLIYRVEGRMLHFVRAGAHAELFEG